MDTLRNSGKDILDSDDLVNKLEDSKQLTNDINHKLSVAKHIEDRIEENRKIFKPVASHGARLYFAVQDLPTLDPMYHFSMRWFRELFNQTFQTDDDEEKEGEGDEGKIEDGASHGGESTPASKPKRKDAAKRKVNDRETTKTKEYKMMRVIDLKNDFREILYRNVCMSLFEHHKLLFAFFIAIKINENDEHGD